MRVFTVAIVAVVLLGLGLSFGDKAASVRYQLWMHQPCGLQSTGQGGHYFDQDCMVYMPKWYDTLEAIVDHLNQPHRWPSRLLGPASETVYRCEAIVLHPEISERTVTIPARTEVEKTYRWVVPTK